MFKSIARYLHDLSMTDDDDDDAGASEPRIAAAALLVEAATADGSFDAAEQAAVLAALKRQFQLNDDEVESLLAQARTAHGESSQLVRFTQALKQRYSEAERTEIIEMLWEVAYADGALHAHEDNLLRRIGGLLYVSDRDRGEAKKRVLERLQIRTDNKTDG